MSATTSARRSARERALLVLKTCGDGQQPAQERLARMQAEHPLSERDAAFAAELTIGTIRHRLTAEHIAAQFYRGRWPGVRPNIRWLLAIGVYQLCWLDRVPDHAAVDQTVKMCRRFGKGFAAMTNGLLRQVAASRGPVIERPADVHARRFLELDATRGRQFDRDIFPDPARKPLDYLVAAYSHPMYLVERWHRRFKPVKCKQILTAGQRRPPLTLRPNTLRTPADALVARLVDRGIAARRLDGSNAVIVEGASAASLDEIEAGLCQPQDATSQAVLEDFSPQPGEVVVDLCAGRGTKSTQAAARMNDTGVVIASDVDGGRLAQAVPAAERLGLSIVRTAMPDDIEAQLREIGRGPDLILLDVPCSNTGVLGRRPEARYRVSHKGLLELTAIQHGILERAAALAGPTTRIVYATCSLEEEENRNQVEAFCADHPEWRIDSDAFTLPDAQRDGGYRALLRCDSA